MQQRRVLSQDALELVRGWLAYAVEREGAEGGDAEGG